MDGDIETTRFRDGTDVYTLEYVYVPDTGDGGGEVVKLMNIRLRGQEVEVPDQLEWRMATASLGRARSAGRRFSRLSALTALPTSSAPPVNPSKGISPFTNFSSTASGVVFMRFAV